MNCLSRLFDKSIKMFWTYLGGRMAKKEGKLRICWFRITNDDKYVKNILNFEELYLITYTTVLNKYGVKLYSGAGEVV